jgi:hypothetical protein
MSAELGHTALGNDVTKKHYSHEEMKRRSNSEIAYYRTVQDLSSHLW